MRIEEINYKKRDDSLYISKAEKKLTIDQRRSLAETFKSALAKSSKALPLDYGTDYIPPDNKAITKKLNEVEAKLDKMMAAIESIGS